MTSQQRDATGRNRNQAIASVALRLDELQLGRAVLLYDSLQSAADEDRRAIEVDVLPFQAERFAHSQAERQHRAVEWSEPMLLTCLDEDLGILDSEDLEIHPLPARWVGQLDDVARHEEPLLRLRERGVPSLRNPNLRGDQFIEVQITLPRIISEETKEILRQFEKANPENPRRVMGLE